MHPFKCRFHWSPTVGATTFLVSLVLCMVVFLPDPQNVRLYRIVAGSVCLPFFLGCLWFLPLSLAVENDAVVIRRPFDKRRIPLESIRSVKKLRKKSFRTLQTTRLCGSQAYFGYWGIFSHPDIGRFHMFATEWKHLVSIETTRRKYVISCRDRERFVRAVEKAAGLTEAGATGN